MANPTGTKANRWSQVVSAVANDTGWTTTQADTWLNGVWVNRYSSDEAFGDALTHDKLQKWLEANDTISVTLGRAFENFVV